MSIENDYHERQMTDTWGLPVFSDGFFKLMVIFSDYSDVILIKINTQRIEHTDDDRSSCWLVLF